jgi:hypothetical protein
MDAFTMVILACVSGDASCTTARINEIAFTTIQACESRIDDVTRNMTRELAKRPDLKGREVTYDVSCMNREQMRAQFGVMDASI